MPDSQRSEFVEGLLAQADISARLLRIEPILDQGSTNSTSVIETDRGQRYVLREYRWPHDSAELDRAKKEPPLHDRLREHGIPAPRVLAVSEEGDSVLLEYLPGDPLGEVTL